MRFVDGVKKYFYERVAQNETVENLGMALIQIAMEQGIAGLGGNDVRGAKAAAIREELMLRGGRQLVEDVFAAAIQEGRLLDGPTVIKTPVVFSLLHEFPAHGVTSQKPLSAMMQSCIMATVVSVLTRRSRSCKTADYLLSRLTKRQKAMAVINLARALNDLRFCDKRGWYEKLFLRGGNAMEISVVAPLLLGFVILILGAVMFSHKLVLSGTMLLSVGVLMGYLHLVKSAHRESNHNYLNDVASRRCAHTPNIFFSKFPPVEMPGILAILDTMSADQIIAARIRYPDLPVTQTELVCYTQNRTKAAMLDGAISQE